MRFIFYITISLLSFLVACQSQKESDQHQHESGQAKAEIPADTIKKSVPKEAHAKIGGTHFMIKYHAPAVRGRTIWGGLVPYGEVWVTGAHSATSLEIDNDITINGASLSAGKYGFFTIPGKDKWVLIINKNWDQHLADEYDAKDDVVRVEVATEILPSIQERLKYSIVDKGNSAASVDVSWEKVKVSLPVQLSK